LKSYAAAYCYDTVTVFSIDGSSGDKLQTAHMRSGQRLRR
jgi:hypothetical protein